MMTAEQLKGSILQLAMQGKLVPQEKGDGDGNILLKRIVNSSDERSLINTKINYKEEGTTEIPDNWALTKLGVLGKLYSGFAFKSSQYVEKGIQIVRISDLAEDSISVKDAVYYPESEELKKYLIKKGSFLICMTGSIGKMARVTDDVPRYLNQRVGMFVPTQYCNADFLWYFLHSYDVINGWISAKTSTNGNIKNSNILDLICPLPPLAEQKRIVAKIEELMPFVEQYAAASTKLNTLNTTFPEMMKKSILQEAVQGKLVEQRPKEGTGAELYEIIRNDKKALMKSKVIKKEKPLPEIKEEDIPFDIPDSWVWVRIGLISNSLFAGGDKPKDFTEKPDRLRSIPVVANGVSNNGILGYTSVATAKANTITVAGRGTIGFSLFREYEYCPIVRLIVIEQNKNVFPQYLQYALQALPEKSLGTSIPQLTVPMLYPKLIPLPPLAEQKRIVAKIEELMPFITELGSGVK